MKSSNGSFKIGTLAGIDVGVHQTWIVAFLLIAWSLALGYFPMAADMERPATYWVLGIVATLLLFASVLVHELGTRWSHESAECASTISRCSSSAECRTSRANLRPLEASFLFRSPVR